MSRRSAEPVLILLLYATGGLAGENQWTGGGPAGSVAILDASACCAVAATRPAGVLSLGLGWRSLGALPAANAVDISAGVPELLLMGTSTGVTWVSTYAHTQVDVPLGSGVLAVSMGCGGRFAATRSGVLEELPAGWSPVGGLPSTEFRALDQDQACNVYAGGAAGLFVRDATDRSWRRALAGPVWLVAVSPADEVWAAGRGVFHSSDGGVSWDPAGMDGSTLRGLAADPLLVDTAYAATADGLFVTRDAGAHWSEVDLGPGRSDVRAVAAGASGRVFAATSGNGVLVSSDHGTSWAPVDQGLAPAAVRTVAADALVPGRVWAGTSEGLFRSDDRGQTWSPIDGPPSDIDAVVVGRAPGALAVATDGSFVWTSRDGGASWQAATGLTDNRVTSLAPLPGTSSSLVATQVFHGHHVGTRTTFVTSDDGGASWTLGATWERAYAKALLTDPCCPQALVAGFAWYESTDLTGLELSRDGGETWQHAGTWEVAALAAGSGCPSAYYAGTTDGIRVSRDGGSTWASAGLEGHDVTALAADSVDPGRIIAGTSSTGVFRTLDGGASWTPISAGMPAVRILSLTLDPFDSRILYAGTDTAGVLTYTETAHTVRRHLPSATQTPGSSQVTVSASPRRILARQ